MSADYDDLTRVAARVMEAFVEFAFEASDANPVELTELFEQLKIVGWDERIIEALKDQIKAQKEINDIIEREEP